MQEKEKLSMDHIFVYYVILFYDNYVNFHVNIINATLAYLIWILDVFHQEIESNSQNILNKASDIKLFYIEKVIFFSFNDNVRSYFRTVTKRTHFIISNLIIMWRHLMTCYFRSTLKLHILIWSVNCTEKNSIQR